MKSANRPRGIAIPQSGVNPASEPEEIATIIYEAATDHKDQLRYHAGEMANKTYVKPLQMGAEAFRKEIAAWFLNMLKD